MRTLLLTRLPTARERIEVIKTALGELKPDLIIRNVKLVNVYTGEVEEGVDIAIKGRLIARVGDCSDLLRPDVTTIDASGLYAVPGLLDGHVHIESSLLVPRRFAKYAIAHGVTTVFYDSHEIGNVLGVEGIVEFAKECAKLPLKAFLTVPSCIPACKLGFETCPSHLTYADLTRLTELCPDVIALGEVMDCLSVLNCDVDLLRAVEFYYSQRLRVCAHAAGLRGRELQAYIAAGPDADHEVVTAEEAVEKLRRGLYVMVRLGTFAQDLYRILPHLDRKMLQRVMLVSDDINVLDLVKTGYLDRAIREAVRLGLDPVDAVRLCTLNTATYYGLDWLIGGIAPGRLADIVLVRSLEKFDIAKVFVEGELAYSEGKLLLEIPEHTYPKHFYYTVRIPELSPEDMCLRVHTSRGHVKVNVIAFQPGSVLTKLEKRVLEVRDSLVQLDEDLCYIAVVERHGRAGTRAVGVAAGFALRRGALAMTICHDSHNMVVIGKSSRDMVLATKRLAEIGGGIVLTCDGQVVAQVELPVAGLMSEEEGEVVSAKLENLLAKWREQGGTGVLHDLAPLMLTALVVIPEVRLTDRGLVDVARGKFIPVIEEVLPE